MKVLFLSEILDSKKLCSLRINALMRTLVNTNVLISQHFEQKTHIFRKHRGQLDHNNHIYKNESHARQMRSTLISWTLFISRNPEQGDLHRYLAPFYRLTATEMHDISSMTPSAASSLPVAIKICHQTMNTLVFHLSNNNPYLRQRWRSQRPHSWGFRPTGHLVVSMQHTDVGF